jgi:hypothetical protein
MGGGKGIQGQHNFETESQDIGLQSENWIHLAQASGGLL